MLGMVEAISIGKALSARAQVKFYANQELLAKGVGNVVGAFFGCMPTSASWTRSAVNLQMGSKTRWVGVVSGLTVLAVMLALRAGRALRAARVPGRDHHVDRRADGGSRDGALRVAVERGRTRWCW